MLSWRSAYSLVLASSLVGGAALAAGPRSSDAVGPRAVVSGFDGPSDHVPQIDGTLSTTIAPDGRVWAVWAYRASREFDVAIASKVAVGVWSAPSFYGRRDGVDELEPALAADSNGTLYLAYSSKFPSAIWLAVLSAGSNVWTSPVAIASEDGVSAPMVRIVRDRVVLAYRTMRGVAVVDLPTVSPAITPLGIQDGPDSVDPLGNSGSIKPPGGGSGAGGNGSGSESGNDNGAGKH